MELMPANPFGGAVQHGGGFLEEALAGGVVVGPEVNCAAGEQRQPGGVESVGA
jgi:hypothetical protein